MAGLKILSKINVQFDGCPCGDIMVCISVLDCACALGIVPIATSREHVAEIQCSPKRHIPVIVPLSEYQRCK